MTNLSKGEIEITKKDIQEKFDQWKNDTTWIGSCKDASFFAPEIIVELFVADFSDRSEVLSKLRGLDGKPLKLGGFYERYSPIGRVLYVSDACSDHYKDLKEGDLVVVDQNIVGQRVNPKFEAWEEANKNKNLVTPPPPRIIKSIWSWVEKYLHTPSHIDLCVESPSIDIENFSGPYIFKVPQAMIKGRYNG